MATSRNILVIDDDADIGDLCRLVLEAQGHKVRWAASAADGQAALTAALPDLVILDVMMEEPDSGFQFARFLAKEHPSLPILMLSSIADATAEVLDPATLPVSELVEKPMSPTDLVKTVERLLARAGKP